MKTKHRRIVTLRRVIKAGIINFGRNAWLAMAAMAVMVVTLGTVLFSIITSATLNNTIADINSKIDISVYLADTTTTAQTNQLMQDLRALPSVKQVEYISKDQALAIYRAENSSDKTLQEAISQTGNPLPASLKITPVDTSRIDPIKAYIDLPANVALEDAQIHSSYGGSQKSAIDKIAHATSIMKRVGVVAVLLFAVISMLIIFNTIQMAIFNRRDELTIMRLLGASTWFIRGPFVVESIVYGVIAALISVASIDVLFSLASSGLQASSLGLLNISYASDYFHAHFWLLLALQLGVGILIGAVSSTIATRRYLKFKSK